MVFEIPNIACLNLKLDVSMLTKMEKNIGHA